MNEPALTLPPEFLEALSGEFYLPEDPETAHSLAELAVATMHEGSSVEVNNRCAFAHSPPPLQNVKLFLHVTRGQSNPEIILHDNREDTSKANPFRILGVRYNPLVGFVNIRHGHLEEGISDDRKKVLLPKTASVYLPCEVASAIITQRTVEFIRSVSGVEAFRRT